MTSGIWILPILALSPAIWENVCRKILYPEPKTKVEEDSLVSKWQGKSEIKTGLLKRDFSGLSTQEKLKKEK